MAKTYLEKRIVKAGIRLCRERVERGGAPITADDLRRMPVRTFSPVMQSIYFGVGLLFLAFAVWVQFQINIMVISFAPALMGIANIAYAAHGRPRKVGELEKEVDLMGLTADIVKGFSQQMEPGSRPTGAR